MTAKTKNKTELEVLETSRIAIDNAQTNLQIKELLEEVGIGGKELSEGQQIHLSAVEAYNFNKIGNNHESISYREFSTEKKALDNLYRNHRKKAKVMFKNEPRELIHLNLQNTIPATYLQWIDTVKRFYTYVNENPQTKQQLALFKIKDEDIQSALQLILKVEELRKVYLNEKGKSQEATKRKNQALSKLDKWLRNFMSTANIALDDHPQLMEALGKQTKS